MNTPESPANVVKLLYDCIESYEQLEILLLLRTESPAWRSSIGIASQLNLTAELVAEALTALEPRGLIKTEGEPPRWAYAPDTPEIAATVERLASSYKLNRFEIVRLMSGNAIKRMRTQALHAFADAFVIRKDKG